MDGTVVAAPHPDVETVEVGPEALVFDPSGATRVALNPTAALVWACLDGEATIAEISVDLAEGLGTPFETVLADVIQTVDGFVDRGIAYDASGPAPTSVGRPEPTAHALGDAEFALGDEATMCVRVDDDVVVDIRTNDEEFATLLRAVLAPMLVTDRAGSARLSLLAMPDRGRVAGMNFLYVGEDVVYRTASRGRILHATLHELDALRRPSDETVLLDAHLLVGKKGAVLVGGWFRELLDLSERQLARIGWHTIPSSHTRIDRHDYHAVVAPPALDLDAEGRASLDAAYPPDEYTGIRDGRAPISAVLVSGNEPNASLLATPCQRVSNMLVLLRPSRRGISRADVEWLHAFGEHVDVQWLFGFDDTELLERLFRLAGRTPRPPIALPR